MGNLQTRPFDFDAWMHLAETDPEAFERERHEAIEQAVAKASPQIQPRLRGLQWKIDMERRRHSNPLICCAHIFGMMWDQVYGDNGLLWALQMKPRVAVNARPAAAPVIPFRVRAPMADRG